MPKIAFVTGADRGLGQALSAGLLAQGWTVYAGQYMPAWEELSALQMQHPGALQLIPLDVTSDGSVRKAAELVGATTDHVDVLINNAGVITTPVETLISDRQNYAEMHRLYDTNSLGPLRMVEAFLPLLQKSHTKRLCFVSSEAGSIERCRRKGWYGYCMSKTALNMAVRIMFNELRPEGFTFRLYHPGWMRTYMSGTKNTEADMEPREAAAKALPIFLSNRADEDRLVMVDYLGDEWPW